MFSPVRFSVFPLLSGFLVGCLCAAHRFVRSLFCLRVFRRLDAVATLSASPPSVKSNSEIDISLHTQIKSAHSPVESSAAGAANASMSNPSNQTAPLNNPSNPLNNPSNPLNSQSKQSNSSKQSNPPNPLNESNPPNQGEMAGDESSPPLYTAEIAANAAANAEANPIDAPSSISQSMLDVLSNIEELDKIEAEAQSTSDVSGIASTVSTSKPPLQFQSELPLRNQEAMRLVSMKQGGQDRVYSMASNQGIPVQNGFAMKRNSTFISFSKTRDWLEALIERHAAFQAINFCNSFCVLVCWSQFERPVKRNGKQTAAIRVQQTEPNEQKLG